MSPTETQESKRCEAKEATHRCLLPKHEEYYNPTYDRKLFLQLCAGAICYMESRSFYACL